MRAYLAIFSMLGLTTGIVAFTWVFLKGSGMTYGDYKAWLSVLLSFLSLISNVAIGFYFSQKTPSKAKPLD